MTIAYVPFALTLLAYIPLWRSWLLLSGLWMQLPMGTQMVYTLVHPILQKYVQKLPDIDTSYFSTLVYPLTATGVISKQTGAVIGELARDGLVVIVGGFCMLSLGPLAVAGSIVVCVLMPAYHSLKLAGTDAASDQKPAASKHSSEQDKQSMRKPSWFGRIWGFGQDSQTEDSVAQTAQQLLVSSKERWLKYWICYAGLSVFRWVMLRDMWPQIMIGICLWLLTSYFHGAATTIAFAEAMYISLRNGEFQHTEEGDDQEEHTHEDDDSERVALLDDDLDAVVAPRRLYSEDIDDEKMNERETAAADVANLPSKQLENNPQSEPI